MRPMDRVRIVGGLLWVAAGVLFQVLWWRSARPGGVTVVLGVAVVLLAVAVLAGAGRVVPVLSRVVAVALGLDLGGAVADRFGAFGPPGADGVSWGGWGSFVAYTSTLLPGTGRGLVVAAATAATAVEIVLGVLLVIGWQRRWVGKATAGLLLVYLVSMANGPGVDAVATYAVPTLVGGALLVSGCPARRRRPATPPPGVVVAAEAA